MGPSSLITTLGYLRDVISWRKIITGTTRRGRQEGRIVGKTGHEQMASGKRTRNVETVKYCDYLMSELMTGTKIKTDQCLSLKGFKPDDSKSKERLE